MYEGVDGLVHRMNPNCYHVVLNLAEPDCLGSSTQIPVSRQGHHCLLSGLLSFSLGWWCGLFPVADHGVREVTGGR